MNELQRITEMYAFVVVDDDGTEGVSALRDRSGMMLPMMCADSARLVKLEPVAKQMAKMLNKDITLLRFTVREEVAVIRPGD